MSTIVLVATTLVAVLVFALTLYTCFQAIRGYTMKNSFFRPHNFCEKGTERNLLALKFAILFCKGRLIASSEEYALAAVIAWKMGLSGEWILDEYGNKIPAGIMHWDDKGRRTRDERYLGDFPAPDSVIEYVYSPEGLLIEEVRTQSDGTRIVSTEKRVATCGPSQNGKHRVLDVSKS